MKRQNEENFTKLNAPKLAEMAAYHWSHMSDIERAPYVRAAERDEMEKLLENQNSPSYVK
jgi:hypothetical protein